MKGEGWVGQYASVPTMTNKPSIWKAVLIAPLGVPLAIIFTVVWESISNLGFSGLRDLSNTVLFIFLFGLPVSYGAMLILGLPYLMWLRSEGWLTWMFVCIGAAVLGAAIWASYWQLSLRAPPLTCTIPVGAFIGFVVGVIFSLVAKLPKRVV